MNETRHTAVGSVDPGINSERQPRGNSRYHVYLPVAHQITQGVAILQKGPAWTDWQIVHEARDIPMTRIERGAPAVFLILVPVVQRLLRRSTSANLRAGINRFAP